MKNYKKLFPNLFLILIILFTLTSCSGVVPPVNDPVNEIDIYDILDQLFPHQKQEESTWCLHAAGSSTLDYNGFDYSQQFLDTKITEGLGTTLVNFVNSEVPGYHAKYVYITLDKIKELINIYDLPVIVLQKINPLADPKEPGHFQTIIAYGPDYVTLSNPIDGKEHTLDTDYFLSFNYNTDKNQNLSIVIYPKDLSLNLPESAYKGGAKGDYVSEYTEPIIGIN